MSVSGDRNANREKNLFNMKTHFNMATSSVSTIQQCPTPDKIKVEDVPLDSSTAPDHGATEVNIKAEPLKDENEDDWNSFMYRYSTFSRNTEDKLVHVKSEALNLKHESDSFVSDQAPTHSVSTTDQYVQTNSQDVKLDHVENDSEQDPTQTDEESMDSAQEPYPSPRKGGKSKPKKHFECEYCGRTFSRKDSFTVHMYIHTGKNPYSCSVCQKTFSRADSLTVHMRYHTGERPFKCDECGKGFVTMGYLREHEFTHTGTKPYACKHCDKSFAHSNDLVRHTRHHTGDRPYPCPKCDMAFRRLETRQKHISRKHERK
ncbi:zinc finger protein 182-like [Engraulis encrasicolus]|uniref:zinc finger protein 182-like n=1 Tax=Engraulis encrasicolus TaxID=184585 RepID=UPI002FD4884A